MRPNPFRSRQRSQVFCASSMEGGGQMKIILVSPFNIANYGAMLQGWALRTVLERMGHDVKHLNVPWLWHGVRNAWRILRSKSVGNIIGKINNIRSLCRLQFMRLMYLLSNGPSSITTSRDTAKSVIILSVSLPPICLKISIFFLYERQSRNCS